MRTFKSILRDITWHEASHEDGNLFKAEKRDELRRFADLGVLAHQLAIASYCKVSDVERVVIVESILQQKVRSNPETTNQENSV